MTLEDAQNYLYRQSIRLMVYALATSPNLMQSSIYIKSPVFLFCPLPLLPLNSCVSYLHARLFSNIMYTEHVFNFNHIECESKYHYQCE